MKQKNIQIRRSIRDKEINCYKQTVRNEIIRLRDEEDNKACINKKLEKCIDQGDIETYFSLFLQMNGELFKIINPNLVQTSFVLIISCLDQLKTVIMLQRLCQTHFNEIFTLSLAQINKEQIIQMLYCKINDLYLKLQNRVIDVNSANSCGLDSYLSMIRLLFTPKYKHLQNQLPIIVRIKFIVQYILPWAQEFLTNKYYLQILSNVVAYREIIDNIHQQLQSIQNNRKISKILIKNILGKDEYTSFLSFIIMANIVDKMQVLSSNFVANVAYDYLMVMRRLHDNYSKANSCFKRIHLIDGLKIMKNILEHAYYHNINIGIGRLIIEISMFETISLINQIEYFPEKSVVYRILELIIFIMIESQGMSAELIQKETMDSLRFGLQNKFSNNITLSCLRSINLLIKHDNYYRKITDYFYNNHVQQILEYLQFNQNLQISEISRSLLENEFKLQEYGIEYYDTNGSYNYSRTNPYRKFNQQT